jgi:hypothetical protein
MRWTFLAVLIAAQAGAGGPTLKPTAAALVPTAAELARIAEKTRTACDRGDARSCVPESRRDAAGLDARLRLVSEGVRWLAGVNYVLPTCCLTKECYSAIQSASSVSRRSILISELRQMRGPQHEATSPAPFAKRPMSSVVASCEDRTARPQTVIRAQGAAARSPLHRVHRSSPSGQYQGPRARPP